MELPDITHKSPSTCNTGCTCNCKGYSLACKVISGMAILNYIPYKTASTQNANRSGRQLWNVTFIFSHFVFYIWFTFQVYFDPKYLDPTYFLMDLNKWIKHFKITIFNQSTVGWLPTCLNLIQSLDQYWKTKLILLFKRSGK